MREWKPRLIKFLPHQNEKLLKDSKKSGLTVAEIVRLAVDRLKL